MVNVSKLKRGDILKLNIDIPHMGFKEGEIFRVVNTGRSGWDEMDYADTITDSGRKVEIMKNYMDFEIVT